MNMATQTYKVAGMQKESDAEKVDQALHQVFGIQMVDVSLPRQEVTFLYDEKAASVEDFQQAIRDCGYEVEKI